MKAEEYLGLIDRYDRAIQYKLNELAKLKAMSTSISAGANDDVRVQTSLTGSKLESAIAKIVDLEREVDDIVDAYIDRRRTIIGQIDAIGNTDMYSVLTERYVERKHIDEIADHLGMSTRTVNRIHASALNEFSLKYSVEISNLSLNNLECH